MPALGGIHSMVEWRKDNFWSLLDISLAPGSTRDCLKGIIQKDKVGHSASSICT